MKKLGSIVTGGGGALLCCSVSNVHTQCQALLVRQGAVVQRVSQQPSGTNGLRTQFQAERLRADGHNGDRQGGQLKGPASLQIHSVVGDVSALEY